MVSRFVLWPIGGRYWMIIEGRKLPFGGRAVKVVNLELIPELDALVEGILSNAEHTFEKVTRRSTS
jgi:hypothetical protein